MAVSVKSKSQVALMREGGKRLAGVLHALQEEVRAGMATSSLDAHCATLIREAGAKPAFLGYRPAGARRAYPATLCVSVNEVVVHGVPSGLIIQDGDIVSLDVGLVYEGWYVDAALTVPVGNVSREAKRLIATTHDALNAAIQEMKAGNTLGDIGAAVESIVRQTPFSIVRSLTGHGIGRALHEDPYVFNTGKRGEGMRLAEGMVFAIEPMLAAGDGRIIQGDGDEYLTRDGTLSAHFEHTVAVTDTGPEVLTDPMLYR